MGAEVEEVIVEIQHPCELLSLSIGANYSNVWAIIMAYDANRNEDGYLRVPSKTGHRMFSPSPANVQNQAGGENDFWHVPVYDREEDEYVVAMKRPLRFNSGVKITIANDSDTAINAAVNIAIAEWR